MPCNGATARWDASGSTDTCAIGRWALNARGGILILLSSSTSAPGVSEDLSNSSVPFANAGTGVSPLLDAARRKSSMQGVPTGSAAAVDPSTAAFERARISSSGRDPLDEHAAGFFGLGEPLPLLGGYGDAGKYGALDGAGAAKRCRRLRCQKAQFLRRATRYAAASGNWTDFAAKHFADERSIALRIGG